MDERYWHKVVADERCEECGLTSSAVAQQELQAAIGSEGDHWATLLTTAADASCLRRRPRDDAWSALECAAHVRDVLALFRDRVGLAMAEEEPEFGWWDHEAAAVVERYNAQDPGCVAAALQSNAQGLMVGLPPLGDPAWQRAGTRRGRERFTVEGLAGSPFTRRITTASSHYGY